MAEMRKPPWIRFTIPGGPGYIRIKTIARELGLHTVCLEAHCPNFGECTSRGNATFLILGRICTRNCTYCSVEKGRPEYTDYDEPEKIAQAVHSLGLKHAVITSVTRDDLDDGGAWIFSETVKKIRQINPGCTVELLIPDFRKSPDKSLETVISSEPDVLNHNLEACRSVFSRHRPGGNYDLSLKILRQISESGIISKSGLMAGLGESVSDINRTIDEIAETGCRVMTIGQYLQPAAGCTPVIKYYSPDEFESMAEYAEEAGIQKVFSGPLVRSSYRAGDVMKDLNSGKE